MVVGHPAVWASYVLTVIGVVVEALEHRQQGLLAAIAL